MNENSFRKRTLRKELLAFKSIGVEASIKRKAENLGTVYFPFLAQK